MRKVLPIRDIFPFENRLRFFRLPQVRLIGKSIRHVDETPVTPIPRFWNEYYQKYYALTEALPQIVPATIAWNGDYEPSTREFTYLICVICPVGTQVPQGLEYRDAGPVWLAHGTTSELPPDAHQISRFAQDVRTAGFAQGDVWCEFYPYQKERRNDCCALFTVRPLTQG